MESAVMVDAERALMWQHLARAAEDGVARVHHWRPDDGLPHPSPVPAHQHCVPTLVLCLDGAVRVAGRTTLDLRRGEALLIEPGCWHEHLPHKPGTHSFGMGLIADKADVLFFGYRLGMWGWVPQEPYRGILGRLCDATDDAERLPLIDRLLGQVVHDRVHHVELPNSDVLAMAAHLWNHLHDPIDADDVVAHCASTGRTKAFADFKRFFARSPKQQLLHERLCLAHHLLRRGLGIGAVAARCGFPSRANLTRAYRRMYGTSPRAGAAQARPPG